MSTGFAGDNLLSGLISATANLFSSERAVLLSSTFHYLYVHRSICKPNTYNCMESYRSSSIHTRSGDKPFEDTSHMKYLTVAAKTAAKA